MESGSVHKYYSTLRGGKGTGQYPTPTGAISDPLSADLGWLGGAIPAFTGNYVTLPFLPATCSSGDAARRGLDASTLGNSSMEIWVLWLNVHHPSSMQSSNTQARCCTAAAPQTSLLIRLAAPTSLTPSRVPQRANQAGSTSVRNPGPGLSYPR